MSNKNLKKITPDSRNKLVGLVNKTAELVVSGATPTEALVKAAGNQQYSPEFILRAAEAYNGAAHLQHFKQAALDTRGDSFELVDGHQVLRDLIDKNQIEKTANIESVDLFSDNVYYFTTPAMNQQETQKQASSVPTAPVDFKDLISGARKLDEREKLAEAQVRESLLNSLYELGDRIQAVKKAFQTLPKTELIKIGSELAYTYGIDAAPVAISLCDMSTEDISKLANHNGVSFRISSNKNTKQAFEVFDIYTSCRDGFKDLADKQADHYINKLERTEIVNDLLGLDSTPKIDTNKIAKASEESDTYSDINSLIPTKQGAVGAVATHGLIAKGLDAYKGNRTKLIESATPKGRLEDFQVEGIRALLDPTFLQEAKEIEIATKMRRILQDPVVSSHSPQAIEEALYEVQALAPNAVVYEPLLRAMLRKRLESEGRMDDFEINQLLSTDTNLASRDIPTNIFPDVRTPD